MRIAAFVLLMLVSAGLAGQDRAKQSFCEAYAREAIDSEQTNQQLECGYGGGRYSTDWQAHYGWCLGAPELNVREESKIRAADLARCRERVESPASAGNTSEEAAPPFIFMRATRRILFLEEDRGVSIKAADQQGPLTFTWEVSDSTVDEVIWQVLSIPLETDDLSLRPPALLGIGQSPVQTSSTYRSGSFLIRPYAYFDYEGTVRKGDVSPLDFEKIHMSPGMLALAGKMSKNPTNNNTSKPLAERMDSGVVDAVKKAHKTLALEPGGRQRLFVRVIPRHRDGTLGPAASASFKVTLPPRGTPHYRPYRLVDLRLDAGREASLGYDGCAKVIGYRRPQPGNEASFTWALWAYPATGTYCKSLHFPPRKTSCEWWECFGEFILDDVVGTFGDAYEFLRVAVDDLKDVALDLSSQFNPFCLQAGLVADDAARVCESVIRTGSEVAVNAYLTANGIPPTLPSSADLLEAAKGDLAALGVGLLEQAGVPCDELVLSESEAWAAKKGAEAAGASIGIDTRGGVDVCRDLLEAAVNEVQNQIANSVSRQTLGTAGMPYYPSIIAIPDPGAMPSPVQVGFGIELTGRPLDPKHACSAEVRVFGDPVGVAPGTARRDEPYRAKQVPLRWNQPKTTVSLEEPRNLSYAADRAWVAARRSRSEFIPSGYSHILMAGNQLVATVESDCINHLYGRKPWAGIDHVDPPSKKAVLVRERLRDVGEGPRWLPEFVAETCRQRTDSIRVPLLNIEVPRTREPYCDFYEGYLADGRR